MIEDEREPQPVDLDEQASGGPGQPPAKVASGRSGWDFRRSRLTVHP
jgi:hypothetical protein